MEMGIASRKLIRHCASCDKEFNKGDVFYRHRNVTEYNGEVLALEYLECPKCKHKKESHKERFEKFKTKCKHPIKEEVWSYIPGECVKQPDHTECLICGSIV